ncbi:putative ABC transporter permease [Candidatus Saccharibacteria bacterium]|nr:putative ABC transporter permease [Candidatus Saccharibacteria bacterium]
MDEIAKLILYFTVFSIIGYVWEIIFCAICYKKVTGRGFLFGPYCPVYGFGGLLIMLIGHFTSSNLALTFFTIVAACTLMEYLTSLILEKAFHIKWWDYSDIEKLNFHGRIGLTSSLAFGVVGCLFIYQVQPALESLINFLPEVLRLILAAILFLVFVVDTTFSIYAATKAKSMDNKIEGQKDQTAKAKKNCKKAVKGLLRPSS